MKKNTKAKQNKDTPIVAFFKKKNAWAVFYSVLLAVFTVYMSLDSFVIQRTEEVVPISKNNGNNNYDDDGTIKWPFTEEVEITDTSYTSPHISITLETYREYDTTIYVADIYVSSIKYLKSAFAKDTYGRNITQYVKDMASHNDAVLAINADYYGAREKGYVIRNGYLYRSEVNPGKEDYVIFRDGSSEIYAENSISAITLLNNDAIQVFSFGPALIKDSEIVADKDTKVDREWVSNPRTAIGMIDDLHYIFLVSDGRTESDAGLSLQQLARFMFEQFHPVNAYNLDGGGSSTMIFNGRLINQPTTNGDKVSERKVSDIVYIGE